MAGVQIRLVKRLQTKLQETNCTILKYRNEIIFVPSFIFIGWFLRRRCFVKKREILNILSRENRHYMQTGGRERLYCFPLFAHGQLITTSVTSHSNRSKLSLAWLV